MLVKRTDPGDNFPLPLAIPYGTTSDAESVSNLLASPGLTCVNPTNSVSGHCPLRTMFTMCLDLATVPVITVQVEIVVYLKEPSTIFHRRRETHFILNCITSETTFPQEVLQCVHQKRRFCQSNTLFAVLPCLPTSMSSTPKVDVEWGGAHNDPPLNVTVVQLKSGFEFSRRRRYA